METSREDILFYLKNDKMFKISEKIINIDNDDTAWYIETLSSLITVYITDIVYVIYNKNQD